MLVGDSCGIKLGPRTTTFQISWGVCWCETRLPRQLGMPGWGQRCSKIVKVKILPIMYMKPMMMRGITGGIVWKIILWIMLLNFRNLDLHCPPTLLAKKRTGMILTMLSKLFQPMCMLTSLLLLKVLLLLLKIISRTQGSLNSIKANSLFGIAEL